LRYLPLNTVPQLNGHNIGPSSIIPFNISSMAFSANITFKLYYFIDQINLYEKSKATLWLMLILIIINSILQIKNNYTILDIEFITFPTTIAYLHPILNIHKVS